MALKTSNNPTHTVRPQPPEEAAVAIRTMFDDIAPAYDRFNAWASLGLHHRWRRVLVDQIPSGARVLDIATGTGDLAFMAARAGHQVVGLDFSERMLAQARAKDSEKAVRWIAGSADKLPFSDFSFGCVTSAFALRNLRGCLEKVFQENFRVLRSGGKVFHLDFGRPQSVLSRWGHQFHLNVGVPLIGQWICGESWPKGYLAGTIERFFEPNEVELKLKEAGFTEVRHTSLLWGVVQLYAGTRK